MDSRIGLDYIVENADYTTKLGAGKIYYFLVYLRFQNILSESQLLVFLTVSSALVVPGTSIMVMVIVMKLLAKMLWHMLKIPLYDIQ